MRRLGALARIGKGPQITQIAQIEIAHPPTGETVHEKHEETPSLSHSFVAKRVASIEFFWGMIIARSFHIF